MRIYEPWHTRGDVHIDRCRCCGSGAGGATVATTIAEAGLDVVILKKAATSGRKTMAPIFLK